MAYEARDFREVLMAYTHVFFAHFTIGGEPAEGLTLVDVEFTTVEWSKRDGTRTVITDGVAAEAETCPGVYTYGQTGMDTLWNGYYVYAEYVGTEEVDSKRVYAN